MQKKEIKVGGIYNLKYYKSFTVPVRVVAIGTYKAIIEYVEKETFEVKPVPNPAVFGAVTEAVPFNKILTEIEKAGV